MLVWPIELSSGNLGKQRVHPRGHLGDLTVPSIAIFSFLAVLDPMHIHHITYAYSCPIIILVYNHSEALRKFADCRNEFLVGLRNNEARTTAKEALRYIFVKVCGHHLLSSLTRHTIHFHP